ncbi:hypothetical protein CcCBS67573_g01946 [Chytriomyces confervae]|uniref:E3 ubiquitin protein ligase n=1 Tax=Chytriomyces confervae TaxID=246404 RepID=A0A507FN84_9FUNG|nr:hypothetical protein CcCBS67573_g01946 [Chytriomyces confervae]
MKRLLLNNQQQQQQQQQQQTDVKDHPPKHARTSLSHGGVHDREKEAAQGGSSNPTSQVDDLVDKDKYLLLSDPDPVTAFQKNALYRRLLEYRRLLIDKDESISALSAKCASYTDAVQACIQCLALVSEDIGALNSSDDISTDSAFVRAITLSSSSASSSSSVPESLISWRSSIQSSMAKLVSHIKSSSASDASSDRLDKLQARVHSLAIENAQFKASSAQQSSRIAELQTDLETCQVARVTAERKYDRLKLSLAGQAAYATPGTSSTNNADLPQTIPSNNVNSTGGSTDQTLGTPPNGVSDGEEMTHIAVIRLKEIEEISAAKLKVEQDFEAFKLQNLHPSGEPAVRQSAYSNLERELEFHTSENLALRARVDALSMELEESQSDRRKFMDQIESEELTRRKQLENEMRKLETDLVRIRTHRDALSDADKVQKERDAIDCRRHEEVARLSESRKHKIRELESKIERLKLKLLANDVDSFLIEFFKREDSKMAVDGDDGSNLFSILKARLEDSEKRVTELETMIRSFESTDEDVRDRRQLVESELLLKQNLDSVRQELASMDPDAAKKVADLEQKIEIFQKSETRLIQEIDMLSAAWTDLEAQNSSKVFNLTEKEEQLVKLATEKTKVEQKYEKLNREKNMVANQVIAFKRQSEKQLEQIRKLEDRERVLMAQLLILEKDLAAKTVTSDLHRRKVSELTQKQTDLVDKLDKLHAKFMEAEKMLADKMRIISDGASTQKRMSEKIEVLKRKIENQPKSAEQGDSYLQQENEDLKLHNELQVASVAEMHAYILQRVFG